MEKQPNETEKQPKTGDGLKTFGIILVIVGFIGGIAIGGIKNDLWLAITLILGNVLSGIMFLMLGFHASDIYELEEKNKKLEDKIKQIEDCYLGRNK